MRIKRFVFLSMNMLLCVSILTSCQKASNLMYSYDEASVSKIGDYSSQELVTQDFISEDLCVVPVGEDIGTDNSITGISSLLFDIDSKEVLYADNIYEKIYPASLTKVLTALVTLKQGDLDSVVTVSYNASHITESGAKLCGLREGDKIILRDLLTALLVYSGNDAGIAIAEHIAKSEADFCDLMNETAKSIGAVNTHFTNSHGLHDENHYTTAYDMYLIFQELLRYDEAIDIINSSSYTLNYVNVNNVDMQAIFYSTNKYLKNEIKAPEGITVIGGKTGTTNAAGNCLEIFVEDKSGKKYIAMVLKAENSTDLYQQLNTLLSKI